MQFIKQLLDRNHPAEETNTSNQDSTNGKLQDFYSDSPISDPKADLFGRWPFAQRVAQTIAAQTDNSNLVVGIYGSWGEGKTSVLRFIEQDLKKRNQVICINFNPWRYPSEEELIKQFYETIASSIGSSLKTRTERVGRALEGPSEILGLFDHGDIAKNIVGYLAKVTPDEYKERLNKLLNTTKKRVVIIMDDIDRLNRSEIQLVFRLLKLSADFTFTSYILAFDQEIVADSLGEQYGSGGKISGGRFLEKIITVPLKLPKSDTFALRNFCLNGIESVLKQTDTILTPDDLSLFLDILDSTLMHRLKTPRMIKRYNNTLLFTLPILKGEAYPVDIMIIEGLRLCYNELYDIIKENPGVFLYNNISNDYIKEITAKISSDLTCKEYIELIYTLKKIFPAFDPDKNNPDYKESKDLLKNKRISSNLYFHRYFSFSVPVNDISDYTLNEFLDNAKTKSPEEINLLFRNIVGENQAFNVLFRLRGREDVMSTNQIKNIAIALSQNAYLFKDFESLGLPSSRYSSISKYVYDIVQEIREEHERFLTTKEILSNSNPIFFMIEFIRWMTNPKYLPERKFNLTYISKLGEIIGSKIETFASEELIYAHTQEYATSLIYTWAKFTSKEIVTQYIIKTSNENQINIISLLRTYLSSGLILGAEEVRGRYNELSLSVDTNAIYQILSKGYSDVVKDSKSNKPILVTDRPDPSTFPLNLVRIFAYLYHSSNNQESSDSQA